MLLGSFTGARVWPLGAQSIVGYMDGTYLLPVLYLGIVPGIVGHQVRDTSTIIQCMW